MVDTIVSDLRQASVVLANGDGLVVTTTGQLVVIPANAIGLNGNNQTIINGEVFSVDGLAISSASTSGDLTIGATGTVMSAGSIDVINLSIASSMNVFNHGLTSGFDGIELTPVNSSANYEIRNTGTILGNDDGIDMFTGTGFAKVYNSGLIQAEDDGIRIVSAGVSTNTVVNSGDIIAGNTAIDALTSTASVEITNTGNIVGNIWLGSNDDLYDGRLGSVEDFVSGGSGNDTLRGGDEENVFLGNDDNDEVYGGNGDDVLYGGLDQDSVFGNAGDDWIEGNSGSDFLKGNRGDDTIDGGGGSDRILGGQDNDVLSGKGGSDTLIGNEGNDDIDGGAGKDRLIGGVGDDTLTGGNQADVFVFKAGDQGDKIITDFENNVDLIDVSNIGILNVNEMRANNAITETQTGVVIDLSVYGEDITLRLDGMSDAMLNGADFIF